MKTVVAALIQHDGRLLACQRRRSDPFPLKWEFPGGKARDGETPAQALARELEEELGVRAEIGAEVYRARYKYEELSHELELVFFTARVDPAAVRNLAFEQIRWLELPFLPQLDFLAADRELIALLAQGKLRLA